jgi:YVTN family beta-propeller protein
VPPGFYRVIVHADAAVGSTAVEVEADELARVTVIVELPSGTGGTFGGGTGGTLGGSAGMGGRPTDGLDFIDARTQIEAMLVDPSRSTLYAIDKVNNSLHFIDLDTLEVTKSIFVGSSPVDLELDAAADELYIANFGSTELAIVDLETQEVARTIFVDPSLGTWEGNPYRIARMAENTLVFTSEDQWCDLKLVNATNGGHIGSFGSLYAPDLRATADGLTLFVAESGGNLHRYELADSMLTEVDVSVAGGSRLVRLSGDEKYVFYGGQKILAANLKSVIGSFSTEIYLTNEDGSIAVSDSEVYDATNFSIKGLLPITTTTMAISTDDATLYLYELATSRIYLFEIDEL